MTIVVAVIFWGLTAEVSWPPVIALIILSAILATVAIYGSIRSKGLVGAFWFGASLPAIAAFLHASFFVYGFCHSIEDYAKLFAFPIETGRTLPLFLPVMWGLSVVNGITFVGVRWWLWAPEENQNSRCLAADR